VSKLLIFAIVLSAAVGLGSLLNFQQDRLRAARPMLPLTFAHADHLTVNCLDCHHNFVDDTGQGLCFDCHKTDPAINALIETQFHTLCRDCHVEKQHLKENAGPTRRCSDCHTADEAP